MHGWRRYSICFCNTPLQLHPPARHADHQLLYASLCCEAKQQEEYRALHSFPILSLSRARWFDSANCNSLCNVETKCSKKKEHENGLTRTRTHLRQPCGKEASLLLSASFILSAHSSGKHYGNAIFWLMHANCFSSRSSILFLSFSLSRLSSVKHWWLTHSRVCSSSMCTKTFKGNGKQRMALLPIYTVLPYCVTCAPHLTRLALKQHDLVISLPIHSSWQWQLLMTSLSSTTAAHPLLSWHHANFNRYLLVVSRVVCNCATVHIQSNSPKKKCHI